MRKINLKGANNSRDLGGLINREGKAIRPLCFLRTNALDSLTKKDLKLLSENYRLGTVIDLRTHVERDDAPDVLPENTEFFHVPVFKEEAAGITHENNTDKRKMLDNLPDLSELYRLMVTDEGCLAGFRRIFEIITSRAGDKAVLWHCSEGKDRCGLVSAFMLLILDVDRETVYEDYLKTNEAAEKKARKLRFLVKYLYRRSADAETVYYIMQAQKDFLDAAFEVIDEKWGGTDSFVKNQLGISDEMKTELKERFLVSP